jgi:hypothetical protein
MWRFRLAALLLLCGVSSLAFFCNDEQPEQIEELPSMVVRYIGDDGLERIGVDFD